MNNDAFPVLYILMRNDMESMNPGKAMAQASHASNAFINDTVLNEDSEPVGLIQKWRKETSQGFGTVLVLGVNEEQMRTAVMVAKLAGFEAAVVHDPTYPLRDGDIVHFIPVDTCGYIFMDKNDPLGKSIVQNFPLHP